MTTSLDQIITKHQETLTDQIVKDAIRQIPSYGEAPLRKTIERVEVWLQALVKSIRQNNPEILEQHMTAVAQERRGEGYAIAELHSIVRITEKHVRDLINNVSPDEIERNALSALLDAVMGAARMVLSVTYVLLAGGKSPA